MPPSSVPTPDEIWKILKEVSSNQKETSEQIKEMGKQLKKTEGLFNTQWERLMESLVGRRIGWPVTARAPGVCQSPGVAYVK